MAERHPITNLVWAVTILGFSSLPIWAGPVSPLQITEFSAAGHQGVRDEDGDTPDWVEIQNVSAEPVNLAGWVLAEPSHRSRSWTFPETNLPPGKFLVLFASGKDRRQPGKPLHGNFKLPAKGGSLLLSGPAGQAARIDDYPP